MSARFVRDRTSSMSLRRIRPATRRFYGRGPAQVRALPSGRVGAPLPIHAQARVLPPPFPLPSPLFSPFPPLLSLFLFPFSSPLPLLLSPSPSPFPLLHSIRPRPCSLPFASSLSSLLFPPCFSRQFRTIEEITSRRRPPPAESRGKWVTRFGRRSKTPELPRGKRRRQARGAKERQTTAPTAPEPTQNNPRRPSDPG